jgi:hypothetical protein
MVESSATFKTRGRLTSSGIQLGVALRDIRVRNQDNRIGLHDLRGSDRLEQARFCLLPFGPMPRCATQLCQMDEKGSSISQDNVISAALMV